LGGNDFINFFISGAVEVPAYTFLLFSLNRYGRKLTLCGAMIAGGVALLPSVFVSAGNNYSTDTNREKTDILLVNFAEILWRYYFCRETFTR
jgi:hypothetical protein